MGSIRDWVDCHRATFRRVAHMLEAVTLMAMMVGGGAGAGYFACQWQFGALMAQQRADHQAEVQRLQEAYGRALEALAPKVSAAAGAAAEAAEASAEAARSARRAVPVAPAPARRLTEAERAQANRAIEAANQKVRESGK